MHSRYQCPYFFKFISWLFSPSHWYVHVHIIFLISYHLGFIDSYIPRLCSLHLICSINYIINILCFLVQNSASRLMPRTNRLVLSYKKKNWEVRLRPQRGRHNFGIVRLVWKRDTEIILFSQCLETLNRSFLTEDQNCIYIDGPLETVAYFKTNITHQLNSVTIFHSLIEILKFEWTFFSVLPRFSGLGRYSLVASG